MKIRIGTIGTGKITDRVMSQLLEYDEYVYSAIYTRNIENGIYLQDKYVVNKIYTDLNSFFASNDFDCVYIASPNSLHYKHAKQALLAIKHVLLEKPFCTTVNEGKELIKL